MKNDRKFSNDYDRKHCGKRRNCSFRAISPFPTVSKDLYCRHVKHRACLGKVKKMEFKMIGIDGSRIKSDGELVYI